MQLQNLLTTKRFLGIFFTQFLGALNANIFKNALAILITYQIAAMAGLSSEVLVGISLGIFTLPFFLFSATAGQLADKFNKSNLITLYKIAEILIMGLAVVAFFEQSIALMLLVLFLLGSQAAFFGPVKYAILPEHLLDKELLAGNSFIQASTILAILFGTLLGGFLILHTKTTFVSFVICGLAILGFISSLYIPKSAPQNPLLEINLGLIDETLRVMRYTKKRGDIYLAILGISWFWLIGTVFITEFPYLARDVFHADHGVITFFIMLFALGAASGALLCNKLLKDKIDATYVPISLLAITFFIFDLYFNLEHASTHPSEKLLTLGHFLLSLSNWRTTIDLILIGISAGLYSTPLYAILLKQTDASYRGRIIASNNIINSLFMVIAAAITFFMWLVGISINHLFLLLGIINTFVAFYSCKLLPDVLIKAGLRWILKRVYGVKVIGLEHYEKAGERVVIIANHTSFLDAALFAAFLPDKLTYAVDTFTAQKWWIKLFLRMVDAYPINPTNPMALKSIIDLVKQNKRCVIFPEGRLTMTGALMKIYEGPGLIADKSNALLLPIYIQGAQYTPFSRLKGKTRIRWFPKITITIFPAQKLEVDSTLKGRKRRQQIGYKLYDLMTETMFESSDYRQTLFTSLIEAKSMHGRKHKIIEDIERAPISYQQLLTRAFILGGIIAKSSVPGEHIGILLPNMTTTAVAFFAMQAYCRHPAMLNFSTGAMNVVLACQTAQIKTIYTSLKFVSVAKLEEIIKEVKAIGVNVVYLENLRSKVNIFDKLKGLVISQFPHFAYRFINRKTPHLLNSDGTAVILFTSGSEGTPKGVVLSHQNIQANRHQLHACIDFNASDKVFNVLPVFHSFGLTGGMILPMLSGIRVFFYPSPLHYRIVPELCYDVNATILFGTDTFLSNYAKYAHQYDFYSMRYVFAGAEKLREETRNVWSQKFGVRVFEGYGVSETSPVLAVNTPMQNRAGTVGRLLPGIRYQIKLTPGINEGGVLVVSGPNVMKGYLLANSPGKLIPPEDGWYETGDVVAIDDMGYVTIKGRVKRFAKIAGEMISLAMVEHYINLLWPDFQHAVVSIPDPKKGEQLILVTTNPNASREEVVSHAKANRLGEITIPKKLLILKNMPLLGSGKIDYSSVKQFVLGSDLVLNEAG